MKLTLVENYRIEFLDCWQRLPNKSLFFALLAAWLVLFQFLGNSTFGYIDTPSLMRWMYNAYNTGESEDGHGNLIPFIVLGLFWWKRKGLLALPLKEWWPGLVILVGALALHLLGYLVQQPRVSIVALFAGIYGLMGLAWGWSWLRASFFPFVLFVFCVPFGSLTESVTFPLRLLVTKITAFIAQNALGIDVIREGTQIYDAGHTFRYEVAAACSGIRSLIAILALSTIYGFVSFQTNWKRLVLMAAAFPLAVIGNVVRMLMIIIAAETFGQSAGNYVHESSWFSLIPYVPPIIGLIVLGRWLREREAAAPPSPSLEASSI